MAAILLLEDEKAVRDLCFRTLRDRDYVVVPVETIAKAEEMRGQVQFRLAICDYNLPDGTSHELIAKFVEEGVPVLFISGDPGNPTPRGAERLHKPFRQDELVAKVGQMLS